MTTIQNRQQARAWQEQYGPRAPKIGQPAPDFELQDINGDHLLRLSGFQGKIPVALIFGSFT